MRLVVASLLIVASLVAPAAGGQTPTGSGQQALRACALLTSELVLTHSPTANKKIMDLMPKQEDAVGPNGSGCQYGGVYLQVDPFARSEQLRQSPAKDWSAVTGVGETAFFHNNRDRYAELMVWTRNHHFTIQMSVPTGRTAESIRSNTIDLAKALMPKLQ